MFRFEVAATDVPVDSPGIRGERVNGKGQTEQEAGKENSYHGILLEDTEAGMRAAGAVSAETGRQGKKKGEPPAGSSPTLFTAEQ